MKTPCLSQEPKHRAFDIKRIVLIKIFLAGYYEYHKVYVAWLSLLPSAASFWASKIGLEDEFSVFFLLPSFSLLCCYSKRFLKQD